MFYDILSLYNIGFIPQFRKGGFIFDIHLCGTNILIECDGDYWHSLQGNKKADKRK